MNDNEKRLEGYRRLIDIARDLASTLDLDILLNHIVSAASDLTETEAASILLYDDAARQLYFQVATNLDQPTMRGLAVPLEASIAGWIVTNRKAARITERQGGSTPFLRHRKTNPCHHLFPAGRATNHQGKGGRRPGSHQ